MTHKTVPRSLDLATAADLVTWLRSWGQSEHERRNKANSDRFYLAANALAAAYEPAAPQPTLAAPLMSLAWELVYAQGRMLDRWAEGDEKVREGLWRNLHAAGDALREALSLPLEPPK